MRWDWYGTKKLQMIQIIQMSQKFTKGQCAIVKRTMQHDFFFTNDPDHMGELTICKGDGAVCPCKKDGPVWFLQMIQIILISQPFAKGKGWYAIVKREIQYDFFLQMIWIIRMSRPFAMRTSQSAIYCKWSESCCKEGHTGTIYFYKRSGSPLGTSPL